jgi:NADPH-dependent curcumin reductase CurA
MMTIVRRSLLVQGYINTEFVADHYADFLREVSALVASKRVRYREDIVEGLEAAPEAFIGMLSGRNFGKLLVRVYMRRVNAERLSMVTFFPTPSVIAASAV